MTALLFEGAAAAAAPARPLVTRGILAGQFERLAREKHADALAVLVDAAWAALHTTPERTAL